MVKLSLNIITITITTIIVTIQSKEDTPTNQSILPNQIYQLNDSNIDSYISQSQYKWFIIFYLSTCGHCTRAREVMNKLYLNATYASIRFGELEIHNNTLSSIRFKAGQVPYIVMIEKGRLYEMTRFAGEKNIIEFINEEKKIEESMPIPESMGYFRLGFIMFKSGMLSIYDLIKVKWRRAYTIAIGVIGFIVFLCFEYWIIVRCCKKEDNGNSKLKIKQD